MTPSLLLVAPVIASAIGLPIQQFGSQFAAQNAAVLASANSALVGVVRVACVTCLLVGLVLYFAHLGRRAGKDLMVGGALVVVLTEYVLPTVTAFVR